MVAGLSVKNRVQMFESSRPKASPRHRMSPRQRLSRMSPKGRARFSQVRGESPSNSSVASSSHPFNMALAIGRNKKNVSIVVDETPMREETSQEMYQENGRVFKRVSSNSSNGGSISKSSKADALPPKSPKVQRQPKNGSGSSSGKGWNHLTLSEIQNDKLSSKMHDSDCDFLETNDLERVPLSKSPRQPKSPRHQPKSPRSSKYQELNDDAGIASESTTADHDQDFHDDTYDEEPNSPMKQARLFRKITPKKKPEWQLKQSKINARNKTYKSPLSMRREKQQQQKFQEKQQGRMLSKSSFDSDFSTDDDYKQANKPTIPGKDFGRGSGVVFWPEHMDGIDDESRDPRNTVATLSPSKQSRKLAPPSLQIPRSPSASQMPKKTSLQLQLPKSPHQHNISNSPSSPAALAPSSRDSPRGQSNRRHQWRTSREDSNKEASAPSSPPSSPSLHHMGVNLTRAIERATQQQPKNAAENAVTTSTRYALSPTHDNHVCVDSDEVTRDISPRDSPPAARAPPKERPGNVKKYNIAEDQSQEEKFRRQNKPVKNSEQEEIKHFVKDDELDNIMDNLHAAESDLSSSLSQSLKGLDIVLKNSSSAETDLHKESSNKHTSSTDVTYEKSRATLEDVQDAPKTRNNSFGNIPKGKSPSSNEKNETGTSNAEGLHKTSDSARKKARLSRAMRLRNMRTQSPLVKRLPGKPAALKHNLDAASTVIQDEKESSVGSSGSDRSCLSRGELGNIASRALGMSGVLKDSRQGKMRSTPLHHLLKHTHSETERSADEANSMKIGKSQGKLSESQATELGAVALKVDSASVDTAPKPSTNQAPEEDKDEEGTRVSKKIAAAPDVYSHFPMIRKSYRTTRLAKKLSLHRQHVTDGGSSVTGMPKHSQDEYKNPSVDAGVDETKVNTVNPQDTVINSHVADSEQNPEASQVTDESHNDALFQTSIDQEKLEEKAGTAMPAKPPGRISLISAVQRKKEEAQRTTISKVATQSQSRNTQDLQAARAARASALVAKHREIIANTEKMQKQDESKDSPFAVEINSTLSGTVECNQIHALNMISSVSSSSGAKEDGQSNSIFSRTARRRQHPAFAARSHIKSSRKVKQGCAKHKSHKSVNSSRKDTAAEIKQNQTKLPDVKQTDSKNASSASRTDEMPNSASMNSIFGDKKGIAFAYWKYSQVKEASRDKQTEIQSSVSDTTGYAVTSRPQVIHKSTSDFITQREENMHTSHELDNEDGISMADLASEISLSIPSDTSDERAPKNQNRASVDMKEAERSCHPENGNISAKLEKSKSLALMPKSAIESTGYLGEIITDQSVFEEGIEVPRVSTPSTAPPDRRHPDILLDEESSWAGTLEDSIFNLKTPNPVGDIQQNLSMCSDSVLLNSILDDYHDIPRSQSYVLPLDERNYDERLAIGQMDNIKSTAQNQSIPPSPCINEAVESKHGLEIPQCQSHIPVPTDPQSLQPNDYHDIAVSQSHNPYSGNIKDHRLSHHRDISQSQPVPRSPYLREFAQPKYHQEILRSQTHNPQSYHPHTGQSSDYQDIPRSQSYISPSHNHLGTQLNQNKDITQKHSHVPKAPYLQGAQPNYHVKSQLSPAYHPSPDSQIFRGASSPYGHDENPVTKQQEMHQQIHDKDSSLLAHRSPQPVVTRTRQAVEHTSTWNGNDRVAGSKPRTPAMHRRQINSDSPIEFKYQDLRSLSLPDQPHGLRTKTSYESDQSPCDDDIFSGIEDPAVVHGPTQLSTENRRLVAPSPPPSLGQSGENLSLAGIPPPPPPLPHLPKMNGRILDERSDLKTVNSDITSSILGGAFVDQPSALKTATSDLTFERMPPPPPPQLQYCNYAENEGISFINEANELETIQSKEYRCSHTTHSPRHSQKQASPAEKHAPPMLPPKPISPTKKSSAGWNDQKRITSKTIGQELVVAAKQASVAETRMTLIDPTNVSVTGMDGPAIMKMGLSIMHSLSGGMLAFGQEDTTENNSVHVSSSEDEPLAASSSSSTSSYLANNKPRPTANDETVLSNTETGENLPVAENSDEKYKYPNDDDDDDESEDSRYIPDIDDFSIDPDDAESQISLVMLEEVKMTSEAVVLPVSSHNSALSPERLATVEAFSSMYMTEGIEVLKLNRRNKWQSRFLTLSSETFQLHHSSRGLSNYPKALLWVKRFNTNQSYSLNTISSEGKGGVEFTDIENITFEISENTPPKSFPKFKNSVQLNLHYHCGESLRSLAIRFKTQAEADFFTSSLDSILDVLDCEGSF